MSSEGGGSSSSSREGGPGSSGKNKNSPSAAGKTLEKSNNRTTTGFDKDFSATSITETSDNGNRGSVSKSAPTVDLSSSSVYVAPSVGAPRSDEGGKAGGAIGTDVNQKPPEGGAADGGNGTTSPRSDFSVVLAGQVGTKRDRSPSRSNNFVSMVGGAGGLGRKTDAAKRTLIGGA